MHRLFSYAKAAFTLLDLLVLNLVSIPFRLLFPIKRHKVILWSYYFKQYSCNPKYITEFLLGKDYDIVWVFNSDVLSRVIQLGLDSRIRVVRFKSIKYLYELNTAEFIITNCRTNPFDIGWKKRKHQKYIQAWHGGLPLKKIEKDVEKDLPKDYVKAAILDSKNSNVILSSCDYFTNLVNKSFWYHGEVLKSGTPRNDFFFDKDAVSSSRAKVCSFYHINPNNQIVLYAPTFRVDSSTQAYDIEWDPIIHYLEEKNNVAVTLLVRLHPNLIGKNINLNSIIRCSYYPIDATFFPDMQELLCASDILVTDYSSSMFDMALLKRPCFLYASDISTYDRGFYFNINELPFMIAYNNEELLEAFRSFSFDDYLRHVSLFMKRLGSYETGQASRIVAEWMDSNRLK